MEIERDAVYEHNEYGEVVVTNIIRGYRNYDVDCGAGEREATRVQFTTDWDSYGAMPGTEMVDNVESFAEDIGEKKLTIEFES